MKENTRRDTSYLLPPGKTPPINIEAEKSVITILLNHPDLFDVTAGFLKSGMFYMKPLDIIYSIMIELSNKNGTFDFVTIISKARENNNLEEIGGEHFIYELMNDYSMVYSIDRHCMIVLETFIKRKCILIMIKYISMIYDNSQDIADIYDGVKKELDELFNINEGDINKLVQYEKAIICACIKDESAAAIIMNKLTANTLYKSIHKDIYTAILSVYKDGNNISFDAIVDNLKKRNNMIAISELKDIIKFDYVEWEYYLSFIISDNNIKVLNKIAMIIIGRRFNNVEDLVEKIETVMEDIQICDVEVSTMKGAAKKNLRTIRNNAEGKNRSFLLTAEEVLNSVAFISRRNTVTISGMASSGKTRWLVQVLKGIMALNENISIMWFSMEDSDDKIFRCFVSSDVELSDSQMLSKNFVLNEEQIKNVEHATKKYESYDIEFVNEPSSINTIYSKYKSFVKKRPGRWCLLVIDNFMLIKDVYEATSNNTSVEDYVMSRITSLKIQTNKHDMSSTIFLLHHLNKEVAMRANKDEGYRPKLSMMKGTTRIPDASDIVILINNISQHKDLIKEHSKLPDVKCLSSDGTYKSYKRETLMKKIIIVDVAKNREGTIDDNKGLMRYIVDFDLMKFNHLKCIK